MDNVIEIKGLVTHYDDVLILKGVTAYAPRGKTTVIVGGSGSGKTTLLKHLIGLLKPTSGSVTINGRDVTSMNDRELDEMRKKIGVAFQGSALLTSMTLGDNVALPIREHTKLRESTIGIMVRMKLDLVGLSGFEGYYPVQLSGGMRKRAGIARAIAMDPDILFFDEPSAGLDPVTAAGIDELILKLKDVFKMSVVVVTHELESIFKIADHVIMLDRGELIFTGTLDELKASTHPRVRMFLEREPDRDTYSPEDYLGIIAGD